MKAPVCICCGQPITEKGNDHSRNPNVCETCLNLADALETTNLPGQTDDSTQLEFPQETDSVRKAA
jgi:hypothetical protein